MVPQARIERASSLHQGAALPTELLRHSYVVEWWGWRDSNPRPGGMNPPLYSAELHPRSIS